MPLENVPNPDLYSLTLFILFVGFLSICHNVDDVCLNVVIVWLLHGSLAVSRHGTYHKVEMVQGVVVSVYTRILQDDCTIR